MGIYFGMARVESNFGCKKERSGQGRGWRTQSMERYAMELKFYPAGQWFSHLSLYPNHMEGSLNRLLGPPPEFLIHSLRWSPKMHF